MILNHHVLCTRPLISPPLYTLNVIGISQSGEFHVTFREFGWMSLTVSDKDTLLLRIGLHLITHHKHFYVCLLHQQLATFFVSI